MTLSDKKEAEARHSTLEKNQVIVSDSFQSVCLCEKLSLKVLIDL